MFSIIMLSNRSRVYVYPYAQWPSPLTSLARSQVQLSDPHHIQVIPSSTFLRSSTSSALSPAHQTMHSASPYLSFEYYQRHLLSKHHQKWTKWVVY
jgi:hypothetical protein